MIGDSSIGSNGLTLAGARIASRAAGRAVAHGVDSSRAEATAPNLGDAAAAIAPQQPAGTALDVAAARDVRRTDGASVLLAGHGVVQSMPVAEAGERQHERVRFVSARHPPRGWVTPIRRGDVILHRLAHAVNHGVMTPEHRIVRSARQHSHVSVDKDVEASVVVLERTGVVRLHELVVRLTGPDPVDVGLSIDETSPAAVAVGPAREYSVAPAVAAASRSPVCCKPGRDATPRVAEVVRVE